MGRRPQMMRVPDSAAKGLIALSALFLFAAPASAGGLGEDFDVAFGAALTSDYISGGVSQTGGKPAVQGYVEANYNIFYIGTWASNVDFGVEPDAEIDVYAGIRPEIDRAAFDLGYQHYFYANDTSPNYGAIVGSAEYYATDAFTIGGDISFSPDYSQMGDYALWFEGTADYALPANFGVSAALAYQYYADSLGLPNYWTWNAGIYWSWEETVTIDLRYVGSDLSRGDCALLMSRSACGNRVMATLTVDTAASAFLGRK
jgi:uncharacterized protein (TIGR02001 family)